MNQIGLFENEGNIYPRAGTQSGANGHAAKPRVGTPKPRADISRCTSDGEPLGATVEPSARGRGSRATSQEALAEHRVSGKLKGQQAQIWSLLKRTGLSLTRAELSASTGIVLQSVCGRVRELLDIGLLVEEKARKDSSGRSACPVKAAS